MFQRNYPAGWLLFDGGSLDSYERCVPRNSASFRTMAEDWGMPPPEVAGRKFRIAVLPCEVLSIAI